MRKTTDRREKFGPPRAYWSKTLDNFNEITPELEAAIDAVWRFPDIDEKTFQRRSLNMVLAGPTGTGKTHCLAGMYDDTRTNLGDDDVYRRCVDLARELTQASPAQLTELMLRYGDGHIIEPADEHDNGCTRLLIDDFGAGCDAGAIEAIVEILDRRMGNDLATIITTNMTRRELRDLLGERGYSRLMYRCKWVPMPGADYRLRSSA